MCSDVRLVCSDVRLDIQHQIQTGAPAILSPTMFMTWQDEDFIGRACRISRRCHPWTTAARTIDRSLGYYRREFAKKFDSAYAQGS